MEHGYFVHTDCTAPFLQINSLKRTDDFVLERHAHKFWQAILVTDGELTVTTEDGETTLGAGSLHILPPSHVHTLKSRGYTQIGIDFTGSFPMLAQVYAAFPAPPSSPHTSFAITPAASPISIAAHRCRRIS